LEAQISGTGCNLEGEFWKLTLNAGVALEESWIMWSEDAIGKIKEIRS